MGLVTVPSLRVTSTRAVTRRVAEGPRRCRASSSPLVIQVASSYSFDQRRAAPSPGGDPYLVTCGSAAPEDDYAIRRASCVRDFTPSFQNALRRWYSTVLGLMNS
jgi:hypothetical protein